MLFTIQPYIIYFLINFILKFSLHSFPVPLSFKWTQPNIRTVGEPSHSYRQTESIFVGHVGYILDE